MRNSRAQPRNSLSCQRTPGAGPNLRKLVVGGWRRTFTKQFYCDMVDARKKENPEGLGVGQGVNVT